MDIDTDMSMVTTDVDLVKTSGPSSRNASPHNIPFQPNLSRSDKHVEPEHVSYNLF